MVMTLNQDTEARTVPRIISTLAGIQLAHGWTDAELAERLGISRSGWALMRLGWRRPGTVMLGRVMRQFPQLREEVLGYLIEAR